MGGGGSVCRAWDPQDRTWLWVRARRQFSRKTSRFVCWWWLHWTIALGYNENRCLNGILDICLTFQMEGCKVLDCGRRPLLPYLQTYWLRQNYVSFCGKIIKCNKITCPLPMQSFDTSVLMYDLYYYLIIGVQSLSSNVYQQTPCASRRGHLQGHPGGGEGLMGPRWLPSNCPACQQEFQPRRVCLTFLQCAFSYVSFIRLLSNRLGCQGEFELHVPLAANTFSNFDKYVWKFGQQNFALWRNTFWNLGCQLGEFELGGPLAANWLQSTFSCSYQPKLHPPFKVEDHRRTRPVKGGPTYQPLEKKTFA